MHLPSFISWRIVFFSIFFLLIFILVFTLYRVPTDTKKVSTTPVQTQSNKIPCPVPQSFCKTAKSIELGKNLYAVSYTVPNNTPILAVREGIIRAGIVRGKNIERHPLLSLITPDGTVFRYEFFGTYSTPSAAMIPAGSQIGQIDKPLGDGAPYDGASLIFSVNKNGRAKSLNPNEIDQ